MTRPPLYVQGMHGLGDNIHQRAVIRRLVMSHEVWLETSWPQIYHDMLPQIRVVNKGTVLRTQLKNQKNWHTSFTQERVPEMPHLKIAYTPDDVRQYGSVVAAMMKSAGMLGAQINFQMPIAFEWLRRSWDVVEDLNPRKPILLYRPLTDRKEWLASATRNPDPVSYNRLLSGIRDRYYVISIADLAPGAEEIVGEGTQADAIFHKGELDIGTIAALASRSALIWTAPGFMAVLARAVNARCICIFGGYENSDSFSIGNGKFLPIDTITRCNCFSALHECDKTIDIPAANKKIQFFLGE